MSRKWVQKQFTKKQEELKKGEEGDKEVGKLGMWWSSAWPHPPKASNGDEDYGVDNSPWSPKNKKKKKTLGGGYHSLRSASILRKPITDLKKNQFIYFIIFLNLKFLFI